MANILQPLVGPWKAKITKIDKMAVIDCVPNAMAFISGYAAGLFHVFWSVAAPSCIDSLWDRAKRGNGKHRRFSASGTSVGPNLPAPPGKAGVTGIALGNLAQRIGFFMAIIDGTLDGIYYGSSLVRRYSGCFNDTVPCAQLSATNVVPFLPAAGEFIFDVWTVDFTRDMSAGPGGIDVILPHAQDVTAYFTLQQEKDHFPGLIDAEYEAYLYDASTNTRYDQNFSPYAMGNKQDQMTLVTDINLSAGGHVLQVRVKKTVGALYFSSCQFTATAGPYHAPFQSYQCGISIPGTT